MDELSDDSGSLERQIDGVAVLKDPVRRSLFLYVSRAAADVSRDEAAEAVAVSRALAAFHLDKLVEEGLLETSFRRLTGRSGPGAGRPAKLYRRSERELAVTLPPREYELAARLFASALERSASENTRRALNEVARATGTRIGQRATQDVGRRRAARAAAVVEALAAHGFEPYQQEGEVLLRNCPFHGLSQDHTQLVCGMNLALMEGVASALGASGLTPRLDPAPGRCCVVLAEAGGSRDPPRQS